MIIIAYYDYCYYIIITYYYICYYIIITCYFCNNEPIITVIMGPLLPIFTRSLMGNNGFIFTHYVPGQLADACPGRAVVMPVAAGPQRPGLPAKELELDDLTCYITI